MKIPFSDRLISALAYFTFGMFALVWIIYANVAKVRISQYLIFNLYQAIFVSVVLTIISILYDIAINFLAVVPFIGKFAVAFNLFFNNTPLYFGFTVSGLLITILLAYLIILSILGKRAYVPCISDIIKTNFGG